VTFFAMNLSSPLGRITRLPLAKTKEPSGPDAEFFSSSFGPGLSWLRTLTEF
jgi:hypothetical protein